MPNSACLYGPPFSLTGDTLLFNATANFQVEFDNAADQATVISYEWFLDESILIEESGQQFSANIKAGSHRIGVRILTAAGWSGIKSLDFYANVLAGSLIIQGPDSLNEGESAVYQVSLTLNGGTVIDVTSKCTFAVSAGGSFNYNTLNTVVDDADLNDKHVTITATLSGGHTTTKPITILNTTVRHPSIIVVEFYEPALDAIGIVATPGISLSPAFTGQNFIPVGAIPAEANVLASDLNGGPVKWRFEFNVIKLIDEYPSINDLVFEVKGRATSNGTVTGAFSLRTYDAKMTMNGSAGSYMPSVAGGSVITSSGFSAQVVGGANGDYSEANLQTIIRFRFNVPTDTLTYETPTPTPTYQFKSKLENVGYPVTMTTGKTSGGCAFNTPYNRSLNNRDGVLVNQTLGTTNLNNWGATSYMFKMLNAGTYRFKAKLTGTIVCNNVGGDSYHWQTIRFLIVRSAGSDIDLIPFGQNDMDGQNAASMCSPGQYIIYKNRTVPFSIDFSQDVVMSAGEEATFRLRINLNTHNNNQQGANETNTTNFNFSLAELEVEKIS